MPIYAYRCTACGYQNDHMQKMSDPLLTECPSCKAGAYQKQVTAAGFQLKGTGWYATDFKGGSTASSTSSAASDAPAASCSPGCACH
ncbi:FmdB family zinc ribbon protein [Silvimonas sp.]|uniref:FmdB family zinc ribbon protein n=1 Tax=Silvimonas sp. TaxID=2650811 RepID=UPI00283EB9B4|nr:FmdB family zinc ribbon protein [Silvimonas sp.]MDR3428022.1 zinc ribbon domain-containing protein [Silvimonas sp.]